MTKPLLIEVGVEELPAIPFLKELPNIEKKWLEILEEYKLGCGFDFFYTPRRIVFWHREFPIAQQDSEVEFFGAPIAIAYKDGNPTNAAISFAKKCDIDVESLSKTTKDGKEILYFKQLLIGKKSDEVLNEMVNKLFKSLNFGKSMRWGNRNDSFIRPIRWVCVMMGEEIVPCELFGKNSKNESFGHRMVSNEPFGFNFCGEYFCKLDKNGVILSQDERQKIVLDQIKKIENENDIEVEIDDELLSEVVAITENPQALLGCFEEHFLELPPEVIITSMKTNQRYFAVFKNGKLTNKFIVVANAICDDYTKIINGNERVLRPRLSDAMFFYKNDLQNGFDIEGLKKIIFLDGLGSLFDKISREVEISKALCTALQIDNSDAARASYLAKGDLLTQVVYEFTELQGLIGSYYAQIFGENQVVATCIKEQYLPIGENSEMPSTIESAVVAMSNKIDTLMALFSIGKLPTGNKDPFALRRAAAGVIKIILDQKLNINIFEFFAQIATQYKSYDLNLLNEFVLERLQQILAANPSIMKSVLASGERNILIIAQKVEALNNVIKAYDFKELSSTFKRVANITKEVDFEMLNIDRSLFEEPAENALFDKFQEKIGRNYDNFEDNLNALFELKNELDEFFDKVFVNHENEKIKINRKSLIAQIYLEFRKIADIKEITL